MTGVVVGEELVLPGAGELEPAQRQVVVPPLDQDRAELVGDHRPQQRNVLLDELLLQVDRVGGNHHPLLVLDDPLDGGDQVREALAHAGSRLDQQTPAHVQRPLDGLGHLGLLRPDLEALQPPRDRSVRGQQALHPDGHARIVRGCRDSNTMVLCHLGCC